MQEYLFDINDVVRIKEGTEYYIHSDVSNPRDMDGVVIKLKPISDAPYKYRVQWNDGCVNSYRDGDLVLISTKKLELIPAINDIILVDDMIDDGESVCKIVDIKSNEYEIEVLYGGFSIDTDWISKDRIIDILSIKGVEQYLIDWGIKYKIGDIIFYDGIESKVLGFDTQLNEYHLEDDRCVNKFALEDGSIKVAAKSLELENAELKAEIVRLKNICEEKDKYIAELQKLTPKAVIAPIREDKVEPKKRRLI
jgi:hypothetical protein